MCVWGGEGGGERDSDSNKKSETETVRKRDSYKENEK